ncbi:MAG: N-6 DNA methylase [Selenomonadaceae bacterium]|nr:N-6 DNA methylase [Selenomonadaceae bacterium]
MEEAVFSENREAIFDSYMDLAGTIEVDFLQKIYQFYLSDRGKGTKQQDYTPPSVAELCGRLAKCPKGGTVYDCCAGSGALTIAKHKQDSSLRFVLEELDENVIPFLLFNLAVRGIEAVVVHGDVLKNEIYQAYSVKPADKYGNVEKLEHYELGKYDACISNPPYNIPWEPPQDDGLFASDERFSFCDMPPKGNANFAFIQCGVKPRALALGI